MLDGPTTPLRSAPPPGVTRLFLVRHGSTPANERRPFVLQGCEIDGPLTDLGRQQSRCASRHLSDFAIHAFYASSMKRAVETASIIAEPHKLTVTPLHDLRECSVGQWEGKSWDQIKAADAAGHDAFFANPVETPHPGGESYGDVLRRAAPVFADLLERHAGQNIVVVAHNMLNRVYLAGLVGIELRHARKLRQHNCCINLIHRIGGQTELLSLNSVLHLDEL